MKPEQIGMTEEVERRAGPRIDLQQIETLRPHKEVRAVQTDEPRLWNYARDRVRHLSRPVRATTWPAAPRRHTGTDGRVSGRAIVR